MKKSRNVFARTLISMSRSFALWLQEIADDLSDDNIPTEEKTRLIGGLGGMIGMSISTLTTIALNVLTLISLILTLNGRLTENRIETIEELKILEEQIKKQSTTIEQQRDLEND